MKSIDRNGTFDDLIAGHTDSVRSLTIRLRQLIIECDPDVVEVNRPGEGASAYGLGERKMSEAYAYLAPQRAWVNLGFYHGAALDDPEGIIEGTGARIRHIKIRPENTPDEAVLRDYLALARAERAEALGQ